MDLNIKLLFVSSIINLPDDLASLVISVLYSFPSIFLGVIKFNNAQNVIHRWGHTI